MSPSYKVTKLINPASCSSFLVAVSATISVFPCLQVHSIQTYGELLTAKSAHMSQDELFREASFVMLQLINALKALQAQGTEEVPLSLTRFVLCKDAEKDFYYRLHVLQG